MKTRYSESNGKKGKGGVTSHVHEEEPQSIDKEYFHLSHPVGFFPSCVSPYSHGKDEKDEDEKPMLHMEGKNVYNGHEYVDLGLSILWATCNVGAVIPEDRGDYYAWEAVKEMYSQSSGKIYYRYDLAYLRWGFGWRLPTNVEINELIENCDYEWTTLNGACGGKFTRHGSIFLSAAG